MCPSPSHDHQDDVRNENPESRFHRRLQEESKFWEKDGLISARQRETILQRYVAYEKTPEPVAVDSDASRSLIREFPLYIRVVLALAVFLVGLAMFLLISFNWQYLSGVTKLSIVGGILAVAHLGGFGLRKTGWKNWADAAFFFAGIMFGVGIWQVGQVFHLPADFPMGLWLWALGVFLMAVVLGSTLLHLLSVSLLAAWIIAALTGSFNLGQVFFYGLIPFSALSLPVFAVLGIGAGILRNNRAVSTLYAVLLVFWWILQGIGCHLGPHLTFHIVATGLICVAVSTQLRTRNIFELVLGRLGVLLILGGLIVPSFSDFWRMLLYHTSGDYSRVSERPVVYLFWTLFIPVADYLILVALFHLGNGKETFLEKIRSNKVIVILTTTVLVLWLGSFFHSLFAGLRGDYYSYRYYDELFRANPFIVGGILLVNALIVMLTVWLIQTGLKRERGDWFWSGVLFFLLWAVIRYIDLFSGFGGMLGAAAIFLFCGLFMLGIVYVWAKRSRKNEPSIDMSPAEKISGPIPFFRQIDALRNGIMPLWQSERNILIAVVIVALIQFGILGAMIANEMRPHISGTTIRVTTVPVDPRDLFRGDYVILRYEFSTLRSIPNAYAFQNNDVERTVFVEMRQDGKLWRPVGISRTRPKDGVFLRGVLKPRSNEIVYGIESYFVQEGTGKEIESAMRTDRESVVVELVVAPDGKASIKTVQVR